ncbi:hypothetical protein V1264_017462 [Littorina saxatilis]|uniref:Uncharacterized protein n=1 Tax=Littorina saxatilis TaxID=31220 RepID=A0AAN9GGR6_9CAEN
MFHVQPAGQGHRDSFISVLGHDYEEIPEGPDTAAVEDGGTSASSSLSSERSIAAGILLRIANPSPNINMSDDPDEPVLPARETMTTIATVHAVISGDGATATSSPDAKCEPPYENTMNATTFQDDVTFGGCRRSTDSPHGRRKDSSLPRENLDTLVFTQRQPSNSDPPTDNVISTPFAHKQIKSNLLPADNLHFIASTQEQEQDAKLPDENLTVIIPPQNQVNQCKLFDDYLHPIASTQEHTKEAELPAENLPPITSSKEKVKQSQLPDDYLHPIASLAEHVKHRKVSKATQQKEQEAKLPVENVRPIAGSQEQEKYSQ